MDSDKIDKLEKLEAERAKRIKDYESGEKSYVSKILKESFVRCKCTDCGKVFYRPAKDGIRIYCEECNLSRSAFENYHKLKSAKLAYKKIVSEYNKVTEKIEFLDSDHD